MKLKKDSLLIQLRDFGVGPIIGMLISLITVPITTRILAPTEFAKTSMYSLCQTVFYLICLLGCDQAYVRFYNENSVNKRSLFLSCIIFPMLFCFISIFFIFLYNKPISQFLFGQYEPFIILFIIISIPFSVLNRFSELKVRMDMRGKMFSFLTLFQQILNFILLIIFLIFYERSFKSIIYSSFISSILYCIISLSISGILFDKSKITIKFDFIKSILLYGIPLVFASILSWLMYSFDKVAIRTWSTFEELGFYSASFKIVSLVNIIQNIFTTAWTPVAYKWFEQNSDKKKFFDVSNAILSLMLLVFSFIIIFRNILLLYLGAEYRNTSEIFVFLLFSPVMYTISTTTSLGIEFKKKSIYATIVSAIVASINFLGNFLLVPKYGALGASITTALSFLSMIWIRTIISNKIWEVYPLRNLFVLSIIMIGYGINMLTMKNIFIEIFLLIISVIFSFIINKEKIYSLYNEWRKNKR